MKTAIDVVLEKLEEAVLIRKDALSKGSVASYDEYKYVCGQIRGLESACGIVLDLQKKMETSDE